MEFIGLGGLLGLIGILGRSRINSRLDEVQEGIGKNNEQVENRIKTIEKIAADANRKAQDISTDNQHFATKVDLEKIIERLDALAAADNSDDNQKIIFLESKLEALQNRFDEVLQSNSTLQKRVEDLESKNFDMALQTLGGNLQTLTDDLKTLDDGVKTFDDSLKTFDDRLKTLEDNQSSGDDNNFEDRFKTIEEDHQEFLGKIDDFNAVVQKHHVALVQWKSNFVAIQNSFNAVQSNFEEYKKVLATIQEQFETREKIIDDFKTKFDAQEKSIDDFKTKFDAQEKSIDDFKTKFEKVYESLKENTYLTIENFDIKPTGRIFFTNRPDEVFKNLKIASNLAGITSFLEGSNFSKKENFIRIVENYRQNLKKVTDKVRRKKFNEDALSEEVTEAFFNTLSKFFLATIPISIYRGARQETLESLDENVHEEEFKFYSTFLTKINEYLASCQVYTASVLPKNLMTSGDIDRMSVTRKETENESEDNLIDEVERLPYYMDYLTEGGETENFCSEGKMVVLKFDGGAQ